VFGNAREWGLALAVAAAVVAIAATGPAAAEEAATRRVPTFRGSKAPDPVTESALRRSRGPLAPEALRRRERDLDRTHRPGPPDLPRDGGALGRALRAPGPTSPPTHRGGAGRGVASPQAASAVDLRTSIDLWPVIPDGSLSTTSEPSVAVKGDVVLMTGNWFGALSFDGGGSFEFLEPNENPFDPPEGQHFCCDQVTIYDPRTDSIFWLQQYSIEGDAGNVQRINVDAGADGEFDCSFGFVASDFGLPEDRFLDFPDLQVGTSNLYGTTNSYEGGDEKTGEDGTFDRSVVYRISLDDLAGCDSVSYGYYLSERFSPRVAAGSTTTAYFAYHSSTPELGETLQLGAWRDDADSADLHEVAISLPDGGEYDAYSCPSPDGTDMCARTDRRIVGAYRAGGVVGFLWNEPQGGGFAYPYVAGARISEGDASLVSQFEIWNSDYAWLYPSVAPNRDGALGGTIAYGGGAYYPGCAAWVSSGDPDADWAAVDLTEGDHGPDGNRWGDYLTTRVNPDDPSTWDGTCFSLFGGGDVGSTHPLFLKFARTGGATARGTTLAPNRASYLVNKDVGDQRWAISLNTMPTFADPEVTSATGNVYFPGGGTPAFVYCTPNQLSTGTIVDPSSTFRFFCSGADACPGSAIACSASSWSAIDPDVPLATSFFLPPGGYGVASAGAPARPGAPDGAAGGALGRGVTLTPDQQHFLVSKDVGDERWAISLNFAPDISGALFVEDVTGNVYFPGGSEPRFVYCTINAGSTGFIGDPSSVFSFACYGADACSDDALGCAASSWTLIDGSVELPASFFLPPGGL